MALAPEAHGNEGSGAAEERGGESVPANAAAGAPEGAHPRADAASLAERLDLPRVVWYEDLASTMDVAHALAQEGTPAGTLVLADAQSRGRGRGGKSWASPPGEGLWLTLVERPLEASGLDVLSLRVGLRVARALDRFAAAPISLKWPNDLMLPSGKLGGILVEVRWRASRPEWIAVGVGINLAAPPVPGASGLEGDTAEPSNSQVQGNAGDATRSTTRGMLRQEVLAELVPALRAAAAGQGPLSPAELEAFASRDWARGRRVVAPERGTVVGISPTGALLIETAEGTVARASGSLILDGESP